MARDTITPLLSSLENELEMIDQTIGYLHRIRQISQGQINELKKRVKKLNNKQK